MDIFKINKKNLGTLGEELAAYYLERNDYRILERNYRSRYGEIDIIAEKKRTLAFIEVKFRSSDLYGSAVESVGPPKIKKVRMTAAYYLDSARYKFYDNLSFDIICLELRRDLPVKAMNELNKKATPEIRDMAQEEDLAGKNTFLTGLQGIIKIDHIKNAF